MGVSSQVLEEAQSSVRSYQSGNAPYPALSNPREVLEVAQRGESIVLLGTGGNALTAIIAGVGFPIMGLIAMIVAGVNYGVEMMIWMGDLLVVPGLIILFIGLLLRLRNKKRFLVLHPAALVYKLAGGGPIRAFAWRDLELDIQWKSIYSVINSPVILFTLPTGLMLVIEPNMFEAVSFKNWKGFELIYLFELLTLAFETYFRRG